MKMVVNFVQVVVVLFLQIFVFWAEPTYSGTTQYQESIMIQKHEQWMHLHGRVYQDIAEKEMRFKIFMENVKFIEAFNNNNNNNKNNGTYYYKLGINAFADLTTEEFRDSILVKYDHDMSSSYIKNLSSGKGKGGRETSSFRYENVTVVPHTVDWRTEGAVTPIKNQGHCGSCWAFSAIAATEGINKIKRGKLISLSEQEILDCDRKAVCAQGCNGGYIEHAFKFMIKNKGITSENNYPYTGTDETCKNRATRKTEPQKIKIKIKGFEKVPINSEEDLMKAVANQPVSVYIDANSKHFKSYSSGIFDGPCGGKRYNHCVTVVGYGVGEEEEEGKDGRRTKYWVVKNSWGKNWGEKGYIKIKRGVKSKRGLCGIAVRPSYPTV